jgi:histidinol-phosphate phosphatase family protein
MAGVWPSPRQGEGAPNTEQYIIMIKQAVILAGGMGTRLRSRLGDLPKPMIVVAGKPLLEHQLDLLVRHGFEQVIIFACYRGDLIAAHFGNGQRWGVDVKVICEHEPLGTAGAVLAGRASLAEEFVVLYGDTMVNVDLRRLVAAHISARADATLLLHPNDHPHDSDLVETGEFGWITAFHNRPHPSDRWMQNLVNAGLYVVRRDALAVFPVPSEPQDFGKDIFPEMVRQGQKLLGYNSPEFIKDIGTPERYDRISAQYAAGIVQQSSLATPQRAVFLDRDGTLVADRDCLRTEEGLELLAGAAEAVGELNHHGWRTVLVTNQPVVAKGWCTETGLQVIHNKLETLLGQQHAFLDRIYYCPHHPDKGFPGERTDLKISCKCRKPKIGMIELAASDLNIDLLQSWLIGDTTTDIQTAQNAGLRSILVRTGSGGHDGKHNAKPDFVFDTVREAVQFVVHEKSA